MRSEPGSNRLAADASSTRCSRSTPRSTARAVMDVYSRTNRFGSCAAAWEAARTTAHNTAHAML